MLAPLAFSVRVCVCVYMHAYVHEQSKNHISLMKQAYIDVTQSHPLQRPRCYAKSPTAQDAFRHVCAYVHVHKFLIK